MAVPHNRHRRNRRQTDRWQRHETDRWDSKATGSWPISCDALRHSTPPPPRPSFSSKLPGGHQPSLAHLCFGASRPGLTEGTGQPHAPQGHSSQRPGPWAMMTQPGAANMPHNTGQAAPARHAGHPPAAPSSCPFSLSSGASGQPGLYPHLLLCISQACFSFLHPHGDLAFATRGRSSHTETHTRYTPIHTTPPRRLTEDTPQPSQAHPDSAFRVLIHALFLKAQATCLHTNRRHAYRCLLHW